MTELQQIPAAQTMTDVARGATALQGIAGATGETAATAVATQARAMVEAYYAIALRRPRDMDDVRVRLLKECRRPGFAAVARYHKPIGQGVEGPSIRFAEAAMRCMGNVLASTMVVYDDPQKRIVRVFVTDLEANIPLAGDIVIEKTVERQQVKPGQTVLSSRTNSYGKVVHTVIATEDEIANKQAAQVSKQLRQWSLRLLPGDILEEAMAEVIRTLSNEAARDPDAERKKLSDAFAALGIRPADLRQYLGHDLEQLVPAEIVDLRALYAAIRDSETTWQAELEHKQGKAEKDEPTQKAKGGTAARVKAQVTKAAKAEPTPSDVEGALTDADLPEDFGPGSDG